MQAKPFIYIKYGELTLKGKNRFNFIDCLYSNVKHALSGFSNINITKAFDHMYVKCDNKDENEVIKILKFIPGIFQIIQAYEIDEMDYVSFSKIVIEKIKDLNWKTFKVETKRHNKKYPLNSMEISRNVGGEILKNIPDKKVMVNNPDLLVNLEIMDKTVIFYSTKIHGAGGFPVGIGGRCLLLISGGIDSPVAASLLMKKGLHVDFLTFMTPPHTSDEALKKVKDLIQKVTLDGKLEKPKLYTCNFTYIQHELAHISDHSYQITLMRRYFFRIANHLKNTNHYQAIATGESLGQVASQTIQSMETISAVLDKDCVVLRPLLSFDKIEIINIAKKIGTYDISILPFADCCSLFVPANPVTKPNVAIAEKLEKELDFVQNIYQDTLNKYIY